MISALDRSEAILLINETTEAGAVLSDVCSSLGISERTYYRWKKLHQHTGAYEDLRKTAVHPTPYNKLTEAERKHLLDIANSPEFASSPPCEIVPALADKGVYIASESTFYRVLRENNQQHHRGRTQCPKNKPVSTHSATAPNQVWTWDITYLNGPIKGVFYYLYMIVDLFSRDIVGWEVWEEESANHASELIKRAVLNQGVLSTDTLVLHSDNGSPMKGATMLATLYKLGITPSNSRPRVSNDNAYSESLFKTLKYRPNYQPNGFASLQDARCWCLRFIRWYRTEHHHSGLQFITPAERHKGSGNTIMAQRRALYERAKAKHPERWNSRSIRNWQLPTAVYLNPERATKHMTVVKTLAKAA